MKIKNILIYSIVSSFFLFCLVSIWKILATLQGLDVKNFNFNLIFFFGLIISLSYLILGNKINNRIKSIFFSLAFTFLDSYLIQSLPMWYSIGLFLIVYFFTSKKYIKTIFRILRQWHGNDILIQCFTIFNS